jgi:hypothetical protein
MHFTWPRVDFPALQEPQKKHEYCLKPSNHRHLEGYAGYKNIPIFDITDFKRAKQ